MLVGCRDLETQQAVDCVVKLRGAERMSVEACARELLAGFLAKEWGIRVVEPVLVEVTQAFVDLQVGQPHHNMLANSIGINYGSVYMDGYVTIPVLQPLTNLELRQAQDIVLFDMLIQNTDRRLDKPNLMSNGKELVVYDHELAFSFTLVPSFLRNPNPSQLMEADRQWIENLFLARKIKENEFPDVECAACMNRLNDGFWEKAFQLIPAEWRTEQLNDIKTYLEAVVAAKEDFIQSAKTFL